MCKFITVAFSLSLFFKGSYYYYLVVNYSPANYSPSVTRCVILFYVTYSRYILMVNRYEQFMYVRLCKSEHCNSVYNYRDLTKGFHVNFRIYKRSQHKKVILITTKDILRIFVYINFRVSNKSLNTTFL